jgi:hypothetical protein
VTEIELTVNGRLVRETVEPRLLLTDFLRHGLGLTGTRHNPKISTDGSFEVDGVAPGAKRNERSGESNLRNEPSSCASVEGSTFR